MFPRCYRIVEITGRTGGNGSEGVVINVVVFLFSYDDYK
jgi:hypothetical protein